MMLTGLRLNGAELYRLGVIEELRSLIRFDGYRNGARQGYCREEPARRRTCETRPKCHQKYEPAGWLSF
mgnify:CR=1 FL=1